MSFADAAEAKAKLDELIVGADFYPEKTPLLDEAAANFLAGGQALIDQVTPWLWAYYQAIHDQFGPEDREEYGIPEIAGEASVWQHVNFRFPPTISKGAGEPYEPDASYVSFEGEVAWEEEHGLQLVFSHGQTVCKVGSYTGHHTNASARADASLLGVIFLG